MSNARTPTAVWLIIFLCYNNKSQLIQSRDHSSVLAWRIPGAVEPGGLPSMGSHRVRHDWSDLAAAAEMLQRPNGRGIEPGNGAELSWRQTVQLMDPHNKITKGTHTNTHTHKTSQIRPSLVPLRDFAQLPLLGRHKPEQGEESGTEPSSCVSRGLSSGTAEGVPEVGEHGNWCRFL